MTKTIFIIIFLFAFSVVRGADWTDTEIVNAIYKAENSVRYPYGIKSINTNGDPVYARKICFNTVRNNRKRFANQTEYKDFILFLADRYCPKIVDPIGNKNWKVNVKFWLDKQK